MIVLNKIILDIIMNFDILSMLTPQNLSIIFRIIFPFSHLRTKRTKMSVHL